MDEQRSGIGAGIDLVSIERVARAAANPRFLARVYTDQELSCAFSRKDPTRHLAGRLAAKEAFSKALGTGLARGVQWKDIEVVSAGSAGGGGGAVGGGPVLVLHRAALELSTGRHAHLSIAYSEKMAVAVVLLDKRTGSQPSAAPAAPAAPD